MLTGAQVVSEDLGLKLENASIAQLGRAKRIVVSKDDTTIIGGSGHREQIDGRIAQIRREIEKTTSDYDREKLQERLAKLSCGVAVVRVGAPTEVEMKAKREALDDAINATKAAVAEGIVPGGGLALLRCIEVIRQEEAKTEGDERTACKSSSAPSRRRRGRSPKIPRSTPASWLTVSWAERATRASTRRKGVCRSDRSRHHRSDKGGPRRGARWYDERQRHCKGVDLPPTIRPGADKLFNLVRVSRWFAPIAGSWHDAVSNFSNGPISLRPA